MKEGAGAAFADRERQAAFVPRAHDQAIDRRAEVTSTEEVLAVRGHLVALAIGVTARPLPTVPDAPQVLRRLERDAAVGLTRQRERSLHRGRRAAQLANGVEVESNYWLVPKVGIVMQDMLVNGNEIFTIELEKFEAGKKKEEKTEKSQDEKKPSEEKKP